MKDKRMTEKRFCEIMLKNANAQLLAAKFIRTYLLSDDIIRNAFVCVCNANVDNWQEQLNELSSKEDVEQD